MSLHYAAEAVTSFPWNRLSDHVGRKPVLLSCLVGTTISILLFGLSRSFLALVLRCSSTHASPHQHSLTSGPQPVLTRRSEGARWRREKCDSGTHGRDECCSWIFNATGGLVGRLYDRVRRIVLLSLRVQLIPSVP